MKAVQDAMQVTMKKVVPLVPDRWVPGGSPDPLIEHPQGIVGSSVSRLDGPLKVQGQARFAAEFPLEGMAYAALVFSTVAKGRISLIDTREAEAAAGVVLVMTHLNAPRMKACPAFLEATKSAAGSNLPVMQDDRVRWNGQPIALVLARTQEQADHASSLIGVRYDVEEAAIEFARAKANARPAPIFVGESLHEEIGHAEEVLAGAPHRVDATYATPRYNHNAIELHAVTVAWQGDELLVHDASQSIGHTAWSLAEVFGMREKQVHVSSRFVGGGFGGKVGIWDHHVLAAAAARLAAVPVRLALSREGVYRVVGGRTTTEQRVAIAADADGRFESIIHTGHVAMTPHNQVPEPFVMPTRCLYAARNFKFDLKIADMNMVANAFMRAPGEAVGTFALESAIDELAHQAGIDPIELRIRNEPDKDPTSDLPFSSRNLVQAWRAGAERFGWSRRDPRPGMRREGEWLVGMGAAAGTYPYYRMPGGAARITLHDGGQARVETAAHEMGMGTATACTMIAAERLGLPMSQVSFGYGDSDLPGLVIAGGSQQIASIGAALMAAHRELVIELLKLAGRDSPLAGLKPDEVAGHDGGLYMLGDPSRRETYEAILTRAGKPRITVEGAASLPLEAQHWSMHSYSAVFCEARVNAVTGELRVARLLGSFDVGRVMNPKTAASQLRGGMIMGMGLAMMEETQFDERTGRIANPSLSDYHVPVHLDVPEIEVMWTDIPDPRTPMGARGLGEIGITGTGAAIANAVFNATGRRVRELPITLDKLLAE